MSLRREAEEAATVALATALLRSFPDSWAADLMASGGRADSRVPLWRRRELALAALTETGAAALRSAESSVRRYLRFVRDDPAGPRLNDDGYPGSAELTAWFVEAMGRQGRRKAQRGAERAAARGKPYTQTGRTSAENARKGLQVVEDVVGVSLCAKEESVRRLAKPEAAAPSVAPMSPVAGLYQLEYQSRYGRTHGIRAFSGGLWLRQAGSVRTVDAARSGPPTTDGFVLVAGRTYRVYRLVAFKSKARSRKKMLPLPWSVPLVGVSEEGPDLTALFESIPQGSDSLFRATAQRLPGGGPRPCGVLVSDGYLDRPATEPEIMQAERDACLWDFFRRWWASTAGRR